jgi:tetratricopeptide (TPR) repeat protein|tara:strand:- start:20 stop:391 length:372 start_codon:yes stop_codon:yes gene_type:complete
MKRFFKYSVVVFVAMMFMALTANLGEAVEKALAAPSGSAGAEKNAEGISHYNQGHWDVAEKYFMEAVKADPKLAVAHYNLALSLHNQNNHGDATKHFSHALKLAPKNPAIANSGSLKGHLKKK